MEADECLENRRQKINWFVTVCKIKKFVKKCKNKFNVKHFYQKKISETEINYYGWIGK